MKEFDYLNFKKQRTKFEPKELEYYNFTLIINAIKLKISSREGYFEDPKFCI